MLNVLDNSIAEISGPPLDVCSCKCPSLWRNSRPLHYLQCIWSERWMPEQGLTRSKMRPPPPPRKSPLDHLPAYRCWTPLVMWPIQPVSPHLLIVLLRAFGRPSEQQPPRCAPFEGSSKSSLESFYERLSNEGTRRANWNQKIDRFSQNGICLWNQKISIYIYIMLTKRPKKKKAPKYTLLA